MQFDEAAGIPGDLTSSQAACQVFMMAVMRALGPLHTVLLFSFRDRSRRLRSWSPTKFLQVRGGTWTHRSACEAQPHSSSCFNLDHGPHLEILTPEVRVLCPSLRTLPHAEGGAPTSAGIFTSLWKWHGQSHRSTRETLHFSVVYVLVGVPKF